MLFAYPDSRYVRRHGPLGYVDFQSFKPWLRDEFQFRCVYCLWRETWCADGDGSFSVDHLAPRSRQPERSGHYENLIYACCRCNSTKRDVELPVDPCRDSWAAHLAPREDGTLLALSADGAILIEICRLNRPILCEARRRMNRIVDNLLNSERPEAALLLDSLLGFPPNLPALDRLRPPGGNTQPNGVGECWNEHRRKGSLPSRF